MTKGTIWKQIMRFSIPMAIGLLFQQLYNTVDTIVVGQFVGKEALAAVGSTSSIINMLVGLCAGLATGASVIVSQSYGSRDFKRLHDAVHTTITITLMLSAVATILGLLIVDPMLALMATPTDVYASAREYLLIYFAGVSGLLIYNMGSGILRAVGDARRPLYFLLFSAIVNIVFDLLFVICFHMGVAGVAYATILSQFLSAALVMYLLSHDQAPYGIHWRKLCIKKEVMHSIFSIGLPSGIQQAITSFSNVFVQSYINFFGSACMAGWSSFNKLDVFMLIPLQAIALASTTFVGQCFGSGDLPRARKGVKHALWMSVSITAVMAVIMIFCARPLLILFTPDEEVITYGLKFVVLISPFYLTSCFNQIFAGALRGVGNVKIPMLIMVFSFVVFRQIYLFTVKALGNSFTLIAIAYPMGWVMCSVLLTIFFFKSALGQANKLT